MSRQIAIRLIFGAVLVAALAAIPASAQPPPIPHAFFGSATVNGQPAPAGAQIEARGTGVLTGIELNPIEVTVAGKYGGPSYSEPKLIVQGAVADATPIEFYIDGVKAQCAVPGGPWQSSYPFQSEMITQLNLKVEGGNLTPNTPTATATSTRASSAAAGEESVQATATRRTPQAAMTGTPQAAATGTPQPGSSPTRPTPVSAVARAASATAQQMVVVATPTTLVAQAVATTPSATPILQPTAAPSATQAPAMSTQQPTPTLTAAVVAQVPRATSNPIIEPGTPLPAGQASAQSTPASDSANAASGRMLALWGGVAALAIALAAGVVILVRARPR